MYDVEQHGDHDSDKDDGAVAHDSGGRQPTGVVEGFSHLEWRRATVVLSPQIFLMRRRARCPHARGA